MLYQGQIAGVSERYGKNRAKTSCLKTVPCRISLFVNTIYLNYRNFHGPLGNHDRRYLSTILRKVLHDCNKDRETFCYTQIC